VAARENLNQQLFEGRRLTVQFRRPDDSRARAPSPSAVPRSKAPSRTLFIGNMSFAMTDQDLNELFRDVRNVIDVRVAIDRRTGQPRGFAHADFIDVASAERAKQLLETKEAYGRKLRVDFSYSSRDSQSSDQQSQQQEQEQPPQGTQN
jgi:RNA recognition motif-containing protein